MYSKQCKKPQVQKNSPSTLFRILTTLKREKNWFLRQFLEYEAWVCPDTAYSECAELYLGAEE